MTGGLIMRVSVRTLTVVLALSATTSLAAQQLRDDSFKWYVGAQGGVLLFESQTQTRTGIPSAGIHMLVMAKRAALELSVEEAFGSNEGSAFGDATAPNGQRAVTFDHLRKYSAMLMAFPLRHPRFEPFLGVGFGILHTVNTEVNGFFTSPTDASVANAEARDLGSTGFGSLVGGVQGRVSRLVTLFAQYQITTAPAAGSLLVGPSQGIVGGLRINMGGAREGIRGGGY